MNLPGSFRALQSCFMCAEIDINKNKPDRLWSVFLWCILVCTGLVYIEQHPQGMFTVGQTPVNTSRDKAPLTNISRPSDK